MGAHLATVNQGRRRMAPPRLKRARPSIRLTRTPAGWTANLKQTDRAELIRAHFGTYEYPTPFAPDVPTETVRAAFRRCYPRHRIIVPRS